MFYGMSPAMLAMLGQSGVQLPGLQGQQPQQPDPLAPLPDAPAPADSINDGINSVGRPNDLNEAERGALAADADKRAKALKKAHREAKGEALLALGAQLMSARTFGEGLSKGLVAYRAALDAGKKRTDPQRESVASGAFERVTDPLTNTSTYERTPVADFEEGKIDAITGRQLAVADAKGGWTYKTQGLKGDQSMDRTKFEWGSREKIAQWNNQNARDIADARNITSIAVAKIRATAAGKRNSGIERQITELADTTTGITNGLAMAAPVIDAINTGKLSFNLLSNARQKLALATGVGRNEQTTLYGQWSQLKESLRNAILLANKGVQTDGDADRAMAEIESGSGDTATIKRNLEIVMNSLNRRLNTASGRLGDLSGYQHPQGTDDSSTDLKKKYGLE